MARLERDAEARVRGRLSRGSVTLHVSAERMHRGEAVRFDESAARRLFGELKQLSDELETAPPTLGEILRLPGVVETADDSGPLEDLAKLALTAVDEALDELVVMREREGQAMAKDLLQNAAALAELRTRIEGRMPQVVEHHHAALKKRLVELLDGAHPVADADLAREIAVLADRTDIAEELTRLVSHLEQLEALFASVKPVGRQLDFLVQELHREVNTIGSKCNDATVAHWVIEAKTCVERMREQVQNVE
jgi:uncharacterized protein (TIGR00255 family)